MVTAVDPVEVHERGPLIERPRRSYAGEMADDPGRDDESSSADFDLTPDVEALVEESGDIDSDGTRHYLQDPNHLAENARDADEQAQDDVLDLDQTELDELGLTLDDPHQPERE